MDPQQRVNKFNGYCKLNTIIQNRVEHIVGSLLIVPNIFGNIEKEKVFKNRSYSIVRNNANQTFYL